MSHFIQIGQAGNKFAINFDTVQTIREKGPEVTQIMFEDGSTQDIELSYNKLAILLSVKSINTSGGNDREKQIMDLANKY